RTLRSWVQHYNSGRPHMALGPGVPRPPRNSTRGHLRDIVAESYTPSEQHRSLVGCITSIPSRSHASNLVIADYRSSSTRDRFGKEIGNLLSSLGVFFSLFLFLSLVLLALLGSPTLSISLLSGYVDDDPSIEDFSGI